MPTLMIQGTTSDAGKSTIVAGLCRLLKRRSISVAPFKPQNMALNSAVTIDGGEIGRAQAVQAFAAGLDAHTDMNPVLLKPNSDTGAQVIIQGHAIDSMSANDYQQYKAIAQQAVLESYYRLKDQYDIILVEGAGSPAEINLRHNDIANMGFAEKVDCPVWIVADIDRGGVFAHLTGTLALLSQSEQQRVSGFIINRFRGDFALLKSGIDWLDNYTKKYTVGTIPYLHGLHLEAEDGLSNKISTATDENKSINIIVPLLPHMSNHTDFDPLILHSQVNLRFVSHNENIPAADLIILPGSKNVAFDLNWLKSQGWDTAINKHLRYNGKLLGVCAGFQMLGNEIFDPHHIESDDSKISGLSYFEISTMLHTQKHLQNVKGTLSFSPINITGYEIHAGITTGDALKRPAIKLNDRNDGAISKDNQIMGTYFHGLFESDAACQALLNWAGLKQPARHNYKDKRDESINRLADALEQHMDIAYLEKVLKIN